MAVLLGANKANRELKHVSLLRLEVRSRGGIGFVGEEIRYRVKMSGKQERKKERKKEGGRKEGRLEEESKDDIEREMGRLKMCVV